MPQRFVALTASTSPGLTSRVTRGRWKYVVVHHSGTQMGNPKGMDEYHRNHLHFDLGCHGKTCTYRICE